MVAGAPGALLVLGLHGWSQRNGWHTWQSLMDPLAEAGYWIVCVDMPGWGKSDSWDSGPLVMDQAIEAVLSILEELGAQQAVLMGKSWGGAVAIKTALDFPDRIPQLVLSAPAYRDSGKLKSLQQPTLLAWAEDDPVIPYRYAEQFVEVAPNTELVTYATGGHSAGPKNAEDFSRRVIEFLQVNR